MQVYLKTKEVLSLHLLCTGRLSVYAVRCTVDRTYSWRHTLYSNASVLCIMYTIETLPQIDFLWLHHARCGHRLANYMVWASWPCTARCCHTSGTFSFKLWLLGQEVARLGFVRDFPSQPDHLCTCTILWNVNSYLPATTVCRWMSLSPGPPHIIESCKPHACSVWAMWGLHLHNQLFHAITLHCTQIYGILHNKIPPPLPHIIPPTPWLPDKCLGGIIWSILEHYSICRGHIHT